MKLFADKFSAALSPDWNPFSATLPLVGFQANSRFFTKYYGMALTHSQRHSRRPRVPVPRYFGWTGKKRDKLLSQKG